MMIKWIFVIVLSYCSAKNQRSFGYDIGQRYSRIRIFEYTDYSDVKFLKFNIYGPTTLANWSITIDSDGKCANYFPNIHFDLQYGAYPLIVPQNESFPDTYISTRHDLLTTIFNRTIGNGTVQLDNPLTGTWFAMVTETADLNSSTTIDIFQAFVERPPVTTKSKISSSSCNIYLTSWLDYRAIPVSLTLTIDQPLQVVLSNNSTFVYASYYTSAGNARLTVLFQWSSNCDINILARIQGLPNSSQYDYRTVCTNGSCSIEIDQLAAFILIYFQISVNNLSCLTNPIHGMMLIRSRECSLRWNDNNCIQSYPTRRVQFNYYYDFLYLPVYTNNSIHSITLNQNNLSLYSYEFIVDDRNIGGTIHLDFQTQIKSSISSNANVSILGCLSKNQPRRYNTCENDYRILFENNSLTVRSLPYPEMALWYLTFEYSCNDSNNQCDNTSMSMTFKISSSQCTQQQCGIYGICRIMTSQQNIFSACTCIAGYRGYGCTDSSHAHVARYLPSVLFLTLSNLLFIPAIILAVYYRLYIEALVYFFNMFFSTFYHACDQDIYRFCIFKYDGLQLSDFIGSYSSFAITLISMSIVPRSAKVFLFMLCVLTCLALNARDRFNTLQFITLLGITFGFTLLTWIVVSIRKRRMQPSCKHLLCVLPGLVLAIVGIVLFAFFETDDNYWYIHSIWHICMATSILFFLRQKIGQKKRRQMSIEENVTTSNTSDGIINEGAILPAIDIDHQSDTN